MMIFATKFYMKGCLSETLWYLFKVEIIEIKIAVIAFVLA